MMNFYNAHLLGPSGHPDALSINATTVLMLVKFVVGLVLFC